MMSRAVKKGDRLIIRRRALQSDGWTYGDWYQYVAFLDDGQAVCCRVAEGPTFAAMFGFLMLMFPLIAVIAAVNGGADQITWGRVYVISFIAGLLMGPGLFFRFSPWRCMIVVGLTRRDADGRWYRLLGDE